jgi:hypothetical protein
VLTVQDDGTFTVVPRPDEDTAAFEATLSRFSELVCPTAGQRVYRLTAASIWRARRAGLTLEEVLQTLETASTTALPPQVRADLERWSRQIDRACGYPVLDRVPAGWQPKAAPVLPAATPVRPVVQPLSVPTGRRRAARVEGLRRLPRQCQATTQAARQCRNRVQPGSRFCRVHAPWSPQARSRGSYMPQARLAHQEGKLTPGLVPLPQLAVYRVTVLMGLGLLTWLLSLLLMQLGGSPLSLARPPWVVAGLALVGTCGVVGRLGARLGLVASLQMVLLLVTSVVLDCLHKEGLILHLCFAVIPVVLPAVVLAHWALSFGWVFVCFPVGLVLGLLFYTFLDAMSA